MVIFDRKRLKPDHTKGEIPGTIYSLSSNDWIDGELFEEWFTRHFLIHIPAIQPVLLLLDGHSSYYMPSLIQKAAKEEIIIFFLPPHSKHGLALSKGTGIEECQKYMSSNPGHVINRFSFSEIFSKSWKKAMIPSTISSGFRASGVYPFNRAAVKLAMDKKGNLFIPFCSPSTNRQTDVQTNVTKFDFTEIELQRFQRRYEEGFNIAGDTRF